METQHISNVFVVVMGMGVTFIGLTLIIFLTMLMGKILTRFDKSAPQKEVPPAPAPAPAPVVPAAPADGVTDEVKVAILAALAQQPGFDLGRATSIEIRRV